MNLQYPPRKEGEEHLEKMQKLADDLDEKSMRNFAEWRDYLHRYYVLILAFLAGTGIFSAINDVKGPVITYGVYLALGGVLYGFLAINIYFYFERRWFQISNYATLGFNATHSHPDVENDPVLASRLNISAKIIEFKTQLKKARKSKDKKKIHHLKSLIRGHKMEMGLMKYLGQQFGFIERFWVASVIISFLLTSVGVAMVFSVLLKGNMNINPTGDSLSITTAVYG